MAKECAHPVSDPLALLIKRAHAFRNALVMSSCKSSYKAQECLDRQYLRRILTSETAQQENRNGKMNAMWDVERYEPTSVIGGANDLEGPLACRSFDCDFNDNSELGSLDLERIATNEDVSVDLADEAFMQELFFSGQGCQPYSSQRWPDGCTDSFPVRVLSPEGAGIWERRKSLTDNICLTITVGKLFLCKPTGKDFAEATSKYSGHMNPTCECLLTLIFPEIALENNALGTYPEQRISIMPVKIGRNELFFEHQSQLFWRISPGQLPCDLWTSQILKVSITVRWYSGGTLHGVGYLSLANVAKAVPSSFHTSLVIVSSGKNGDGNGQKCVTVADEGNEKKQIPRSFPAHKKSTHKGFNHLKSPGDGNTAMGVIEIGLKLSRGVQEDPKNLLVCFRNEELWLYVHLHGIDNILNWSLVDNRRTQGNSLLLIRSGLHCAFKFLSITSCMKKGQRKSKPTRVRLADAVLPAPGEAEGAVVFLEIWDSWKVHSRLKMGGLDDFLGLVKVPLSPNAFKKRILGICDIAASGMFPVWHPRCNAVNAEVNITILRGTRADMLRAQEENQAAAVIQTHVKSFLETTSESRNIENYGQFWKI